MKPYMLKTYLIRVDSLALGENTDLDTHGCYIVGSVFGKTGGRDGVLNSRKKYTEIYPLIFKAIKSGIVKVTYIDHE